MTNSNGERTITYSYVSIHANPSAASFIPVVGFFASSHSNMQNEGVTFVFDANGILKAYSTYNSGSNCSGSAIGTASCNNSSQIQNH